MNINQVTLHHAIAVIPSSKAEQLSGRNLHRLVGRVQ